MFPGNLTGIVSFGQKTLGMKLFRESGSEKQRNSAQELLRNFCLRTLDFSVKLLHSEKPYIN